MAVRPVFIVSNEYPYVKKANINFEWFSGFAKSQKQKSIKSLHEEFNNMYDDKRILEISSKSDELIGEKLSPFYLTKYVPSLDKNIPVECIFQASKVFINSGAKKELLLEDPLTVKKVIKGINEPIISFNYESHDYPLKPTTVFFDWLYLNALLEHEELIKDITKYDAFSDIEFNPKKSLNCQARAAATFVSLYRLNKLDEIKDFNKFYELMKGALK